MWWSIAYVMGGWGGWELEKMPRQSTIAVFITLHGGTALTNYNIVLVREKTVPYNLSEVQMYLPSTVLLKGFVAVKRTRDQREKTVQTVPHHCNCFWIILYTTKALTPYIVVDERCNGQLRSMWEDCVTTAVSDQKCKLLTVYKCRWKGQRHMRQHASVHENCATWHCRFKSSYKMQHNLLPFTTVWWHGCGGQGTFDSRRLCTWEDQAKQKYLFYSSCKGTYSLQQYCWRLWCATEASREKPCHTQKSPFRIIL